MSSGVHYTFAIIWRMTQINFCVTLKIDLFNLPRVHIILLNEILTLPYTQEQKKSLYTFLKNFQNVAATFKTHHFLP